MDLSVKICANLCHLWIDNILILRVFVAKICIRVYPRFHFIPKFPLNSPPRTAIIPVSKIALGFGRTLPCNALIFKNLRIYWTRTGIKSLFEIIQKELIGPNLHRYEIHAPRIARAHHCGQFVIIRPKDHSERIPITVASKDQQKGNGHSDLQPA